MLTPQSVVKWKPMLPHRSLRTRSACLLLALFLIVVVGLFGLPKDTYFPFFALEPVTCLRVPVRSPVSFESLVLPAPSPHNSLQLAQLWQRLTDIYHAHPPTPHCIIRPILSGPSNINDFTLEQANAAFKLNPKQALRTRESQQRVLELLPDYSSFGTLFQGRGIVILAGGRFSSVATVSIAILRRSHGSSLPVEVWMPHDTEDDVLWIDDMRNLGVSIRYLSEYAPMGSLLDWVNPMAWAKKQRPWNPYQWKIMALLFSSFEEILFLDADSVPAVKSERIFETEAYHSTGAVIWPDYWPKVTSSVLPYLVGLSNSPSDLWWHKPTAESGQMLGNEKHHWQSLLLACYYNYHGPAFWYTASVGNVPGWGDKETYLLALMATKESYFMVAERVRMIGLFNRTLYAASGQHMPGPTDEGTEIEIAFYHQCGGMKWSLENFMKSWDSQDSLWTYARASLWGKFLAKDDGPTNGQRSDLSLGRDESEPEVMIWRGLEYVACWTRSHGSATACDWVRARMSGSLGETGGIDGSIHTCSSEKPEDSVMTS